MKVKKPHRARRLEMDAVTLAKHSLVIPVFNLKNPFDHIENPVPGARRLLQGLFHIRGKVEHKK